MKNYIFFVGGTGARVYRAFLHSCAAGAIPAGTVKTLLVDADSKSAAGEECIELYGVYQTYRKIIREDTGEGVNPFPVFQCGVEMDGNAGISPVQPNISHLEQVAGGDRNTIRAMKWFYTKEEREQSITKGFYARPNIGCVFFQDFNSPVLKNTLTGIKRLLQKGEEVRVILAGSVFGGTGAAGVPSLLKMMRKECKENLDDLHCDAVLITPYFSMKEKGTENDDIEINREDFFYNTREALRYYRPLLSEGFESIYLVGKKSLDLVNLNYVDGGAGQKNKPHIVELYGAMAIEKLLSGEPANGLWGYIAGDGNVDWQSVDNEFCVLPDMLRAQMILENEIYPYLEEMEEGAPSIWQRRYQWYTLYDMASTENRKKMAAIRTYSRQFLEWMYYIQSKYEDGRLCHNGAVRLCGEAIDCFAPERLYGPDEAPPEKKLRDRFNELVDFSSNIEYVLDKAALLLSYLGVAPPALATLGCAGMLLRLIGLAGEKK